MLPLEPPDKVAHVILETCRAEDVSLFVGAGISIQPPSSLPSANDLKWRILETLAGKKPPRGEDRALIQEYLDAHMLEFFIQDLKECLGPGAMDLFDVFRHGQPNLYHHVIAHLARERLIRRVITTNFDCLIESALRIAGVEHVVLSTDHDFAEWLVRPEDFAPFNVIKLHGTVAFTKEGRESPGPRKVKAVSPLLIEMRKYHKLIEGYGLHGVEVGTERELLAGDTLVASLDNLGISLTDTARELLVSHLKNSTTIVMGWNGFDLDISPLFLEHARTVKWIVHRTQGEPDTSRSLIATKLAAVLEDLKSRGLDETRAQLVLLANTKYPLNVLPNPAAEREALRKRSDGHTEHAVFTPHLISSLVAHLQCDVPAVISGRNRPAAASPLPLKLRIVGWGKDGGLDQALQWGLARFLLHHGEYESAKKLIDELLAYAEDRRLPYLTALVHVDLGELNAIHGDRGDAERALQRAVELHAALGPPDDAQDSIHHALAERIPLRAYFLLGELASEFMDYEAAEAAFRDMPVADTIQRALVHYCREEFDAAKSLLADTIRYPRIGEDRFHHYLFYFLKLLDARIHWLQGTRDYAAAEFHDVLSATTKLGFPRLQVQALNGLAMTYSDRVAGKYDGLQRIDPLGRVDTLYDVFKAAQCAAQAILIANQAEYRCGRAHAGYYMGSIYARVGLPRDAIPALRYSEQLFKKLGHEAGVSYCKDIKARFGLAW